MANTPNENKTEGMKHQAKGKAKEVAGAARGDTKQEVEGKVEKNVGKAQKEVGKQQGENC